MKTLMHSGFSFFFFLFSSFQIQSRMTSAGTNSQKTNKPGSKAAKKKTGGYNPKMDEVDGFKFYELPGPVPPVTKFRCCGGHPGKSLVRTFLLFAFRCWLQARVHFGLRQSQDAGRFLEDSFAVDSDVFGQGSAVWLFEARDAACTTVQAEAVVHH